MSRPHPKPSAEPPLSPSSRALTQGTGCFARIVLAALALVTATLLFTATPAFAVEAHLFSRSFGTSGAGAGQVSLVAPNHFVGPNARFPQTAGSGVAVNDQTGDVYVADTLNHRIDQFSSTGSFVRAWGWGVANGAPEFQACTATCQIGIPGSAPGQFESPLSIAVDNSGGPSEGAVYVADTESTILETDGNNPEATDLTQPGTNLIQKFDSAGNLLTSWGSGGQLDGSTTEGGLFGAEVDGVKGQISGITTDESGNLFIDSLNRAIDEIAPDGTPGPTVPIAPQYFSFPIGIGADPSGQGDLYWSAESGNIFRFDLNGNLLGQVEVTVQDNVYEYAASGFAVDSTTGDIYSGHPSIRGSGSQIRHFRIDGSGDVVESDGSPCPVEPGGRGCERTDTFGSEEPLSSENLSSVAGLAVNAETHTVYAADPKAQRIAAFADGILADATGEPTTELTKTSVHLHGHLTPDGGTPVISCHFEYVTEEAFKKTGFSDLSSGGNMGCDQPTPISAATDLSASVAGLTGGTAYRVRIAVINEFGPSVSPVQTVVTPPAVTALITGPVTELTNVSASLTGSFVGDGIDTHYYFQYGKSTSYNHITPALPGADQGEGIGLQSLSAMAEGLTPGVTYHYRVVATNLAGITLGEDRTFRAATPPTIESFSSTNLAATSVDLLGTINPQSSEVQTQCHFDYGSTVSYGSTAACPEALLGTTAQQVIAHLSGLQSGVTYHFRLVAENKWGAVTSEDQSFEFFPPACPNAAVRQQTGSAYLPDCRAYELVSPGNANATLLFPGGPNPGTATSPSRFAYTGDFSSPPEAGNVIGTVGDLYVATRTNTGWVSRYVGLGGDEAGCMGGPPTGNISHAAPTVRVQNFVLTNLDMSRFLDWNLGSPVSCYTEGNGTGDAAYKTDLASNAPYLWDSAGNLVQHLPSNLDSTPGAAAALTCPTEAHSNPVPKCHGEDIASPDLTHLIFSANNLSFAEPGEPAGLEAAPGSAYDDNLATGKVELISKLPNGENIPQDPSFALVPPEKVNGGTIIKAGGPEEFIRFPAVSTDGSHILMSTATKAIPFCILETVQTPCSRYIDTPVHLYMRVGGGEGQTFEIAGGKAVSYVDMTPAGSKVYFTSTEQLLPEDGDTSVDLYMWSQIGAEEGHPITLVSGGPGGVPGTPGNTDECNALWTDHCSIATLSFWEIARMEGGQGGNGLSDNSVAATNGDIYFYSPELLDGDNGTAGQQNLYVYRNGSDHFVATFTPGPSCPPGALPVGCNPGPIARMQVSPDDSHAAFLTASQITPYDNAGHFEMYTYTPSTGAIVCVSCNPLGSAPTANVYASENGLFMSDDGRVFFSTEEALVREDTNKGEDVYEYAEGRPQLITSGTGTVTIPGSNLVTQQEIPGLVGVSANGGDVYISTYDNLTAEDHNGAFLKFYDARVNGGFAQPTPVAPCAAAEECHGPGTEAPQLPTQGTAAGLTGGNFTPAVRHRNKKRNRKAERRHHHKRAAKQSRGGGK